MERLFRQVISWLTTHWKRVLIFGGSGLVVVLVLVQIFYPSDRLMPLATVDGLSVGGWRKSEASSMLDSRYKDYPTAVYFGTSDKAYRSPKPAQIGLTVSNKERIDNMKYPWYLRLVPTSLFWAQATIDTKTPLYSSDSSKLKSYIVKELGDSCKVEPVDATLKADADKLKVVPAVPGGTCELNDVETALARVKPVLTEKSTVRINVTVVPPAVTDADARQVGDAIAARLGEGVAVKAGGEIVQLASTDIITWLDFATVDGVLTPSMSVDRAGQALSGAVGPKVTIPAGVSKITTRDFTEISRQNGATGQALAVDKTLASLLDYINHKTDEVVAVTNPVSPREEYTRTYSPTDVGLSALLKQYADDHEGTYGVTLIELDGKKRRATYNGDKRFVTASTYKLLVAYSLLKQIDAGARDWGSNADCFNKMISLSDNPCSESFLNSLGLKNVTDDVNGIGLKNSTFMIKGGPFTTSDDLALLLGMLQTGQGFSGTGRDRLLSAMRANVYRKGIPAGVSGTVADKVGFMDGLLHDAAIVNGPSGTYVLVIMTDGSSWANIADLAKKVDQLRAG